MGTRTPLAQNCRCGDSINVSRSDAFRDRSFAGTDGLLMSRSVVKKMPDYSAFDKKRRSKIPLRLRRAPRLPAS
jgi:hypothetical protein